MASVALGYWVHPAWFLFTAFVGLNLFQSAFTNWCPMMTLLRRLGVQASGGRLVSQKCKRRSRLLNPWSCGWVRGWSPCGKFAKPRSLIENLQGAGDGCPFSGEWFLSGTRQSGTRRSTLFVGPKTGPETGGLRQICIAAVRPLFCGPHRLASPQLVAGTGTYRRSPKWHSSPPAIPSSQGAHWHQVLCLHRPFTHAPKG